MTNVDYGFMERRQATMANDQGHHALAWADVYGDWDPNNKGDGNYDAAMRRETMAPRVGEIAALAEVAEPAHDLPTLPYRPYWDIEDFPENASVIFPKNVWNQ